MLATSLSFLDYLLLLSLVYPGPISSASLSSPSSLWLKLKTTERIMERKRTSNDAHYFIRMLNSFKFWRSSL